MMKKVALVYLGHVLPVGGGFRPRGLCPGGTPDTAEFDTIGLRFIIIFAAYMRLNQHECIMHCLNYL